jgi:uncharacterized protein (DUF1800 family)
MLSAAPSFERIALNRVTFGARSVDELRVKQIGWPAWVNEQLSPPPGDDPALEAYLRAQTMHIEYAAYSAMNLSWPAVKEDRPLQWLWASASTIYTNVRDKINYSSVEEQLRPFDELCSAINIRNAHSRYQLREFMADFWLNHFSISANKDIQGRNALIVYDRDVVRANVFGNFRTLLEGVATSLPMLQYLDNADSQASHPNENYARELMELHTMGRDVYLGKSPGGDVSAMGFTDDDIIQASRALSGWTISKGQYGASGPLPDTGAFVFNPYQHNTSAGVCLGFDLSTISDGMAQGSKVLDLTAHHPATATFICTKLCKRIFGDSPPAAAIARAVAAWNANQSAPDQVAKVLRAVLLDGTEIGIGPVIKVRRPHERVIAFARTTGSTVNANPYWNWMLQSVNDSPFCWPTPDGRPDTNAFWLNTATNVLTWNMMQSLAYSTYVAQNYADATPQEVMASATLATEYWVGLMIGYSLSPTAMNALAGMIGSINGGYKWDPVSYNIAIGQQFVAAIATAPEFVLR